MSNKIKTYSTHPELCVVGAKIHVLMPANWIGAHGTNESNVWLPAKIIKIEPSKYECPYIYTYVRASQKYHTVSVKNLMILPSQVEDNIRFR